MPGNPPPQQRLQAHQPTTNGKTMNDDRCPTCGQSTTPATVTDQIIAAQSAVPIQYGRPNSIWNQAQTEIERIALIRDVTAMLDRITAGGEE